MWGIVADKVSEPKAPATLWTLKRKLRRVWSQIPDETIRHCARGMPERLREVIEEGWRAAEIILIKSPFCFVCVLCGWTEVFGVDVAEDEHE